MSGLSADEAVHRADGGHKLGAAKPSVLFVTNHPDMDASNRYRIYQFLPFLRAAGIECAVRPFTSPELFRLLKKPGAYARKSLLTVQASVRRLFDALASREYGLLFIHREAFPFGTPWMERICRRFNRRLVFGFDDAIYAGHQDAHIGIHPFLYKFKYGPHVDWTIRNSVHVIVGNDFLAAYARRLNPNVTVVPTVIDTQVFRPSEHPGGSKIRIGWMGSPTTSGYLYALQEVLKELVRRHPEELEIHFYGDPHVPRFTPGVFVHDFCLETEVQDLQSLDIGIMPLPDNEWTKGKCAFKAIQYMAVGMPTVASPVGMVRELIVDHHTGLLASSAEEWLQKLSLLIESKALRQQIGARGRKRVEEGFSLEVWGPRFARLLENVYAECCGGT